MAGQLDHWSVYSNPEHILQSRYPNLLFINRVFGLTFVGYYMLVFIYFDPSRYLNFLTNWSMTLTFLYYGTVLCSYLDSKYTHLSVLLLHTSWVLQGIITVMFWVLIYPIAENLPSLALMIPTHGLFLIPLGVDIVLSNVQFKRSNGMLALIFGLAYNFLINMPYSLLVAPVYPQITFKNLHTVMAAVQFVILLYICNESGILLSKKKSKEELNKVL